MSRQASGLTPRRAAVGLACLAGAAGLSAEILWARMLSIEVGSALAALSVVVGAVMLGLSLGAARLGAAADRTRRPARLFARCQAGAAAMILVSSFIAWSGGLARPLIQRLHLEPGTLAFLLVVGLTYGLFVCAASFLMGGTLPLLLRSASDGEPFGRRTGTLAAGNAAGAAIGALVCGFVLLPHLGLRASLVSSAALSLLAATLASRWRTAPSPMPAGGQPSGSPSRPAPGPGRSRALAALFVSGCAVTALEVGWTRIAFYSFGSSAQAASLVLAAAIAGLAIGSAAAVRTKPARLPHESLSLLLSAGALAIVVTDPLLGRLPLAEAWLAGWLESGAESWGITFLGQAVRFGLLFAFIGAPSALLGACFPAGCRALRAERDTAGGEGRDAGLASAACAAGNMLGAPVACFAVLPLSGSRGCLLVSAAALVLVGWLAGSAPPSAERSPGSAGGGRLKPAAVLLILVATGALLPWDLDLISSGPYLYGALYASALDRSGRDSLADALRARGEIVFSREGPEALVTVRRSREGLLSLQVNGKTDASTGGDVKTQSLTAHLPLLLRSSSSSDTAERVLVIGLGSGITAAAALTHPVRSVDIVEISAEVKEAAGLFEDANRGALRDPRVTLMVRDARAHLLFGSGDAATAPGSPTGYDVIASQPSNPWVAGQAILFTREFFSLARGRLAPGGFMCQWVQGQGLAPDDFRSIVATFAGVFAYVSLWEESTSGGDYLLVGSMEPLRLDMERLAASMSRPPVMEDLARAEIGTPVDLLSHLVAGDEGVRALARGAREQREDRLALEFTAPAAIHRETLGAILKTLEPIRADPARLPGVEGAIGAELSRRIRLARKERSWAAGLGLLDSRLSRTDADLMRAASYLRAGMRSHALETVRALALRRPSERLPHLMQAHLLMSVASAGETGAREEAIRELRVAVALDPEEPGARLFLSRALYAAGRLDEAIAENAMIPPPLPAEAHSDRCAMLLAGEDLPSAEAACLEAVSLDADLAEAHANLGLVRARRGRPAAAESSYRRALELDPDLDDARYNLVTLCERQGRASEGLSLLGPLLDDASGRADASILRLAARLALATGDRRRARIHLEASLQAEPGNPESLEMRRWLGANP